MKPPPPDSEQGELWPYLRPETVLLYCRHLEAVTLAIAPEMTLDDCSCLLGELTITMRELDRINARIRTSREWQLRQRIPALIPEPASGDRLETARKCAPPKVPPSLKQPPAWPDKGFVRRRFPRGS